MPAIALDLSLVSQKYQKLTAPFGFDVGGFGARFWKFLLPMFCVSNQFLRTQMFNKMSFMFKHCFSGSGWAGGVTRSVKNFVCILWFSIFSLDVTYLSFDSLVEGPLYVNLEKEN